MINVLGENYFIDLDEVESYLEMPEGDGLEIVSGNTEMRINVIKFELVKLLLETVLSEQDFVDDKLGLSSKNEKNTTIPFRLAFNTLLNKKLINHY
jgi:hypothetical protein